MNNGKKLLFIGVAVILSLSIIVFTVLQVRKQQETRSRASGGTVILTINPETTTKSVGETFSADVFLNNSGFDISGINMVVKFDNNVLEIINFQPTEVFSKIANTPNNQSGTLLYYASNISTDKITDNNIKIGTLNFKAKTKGTALVGFQKAEITASRQTAFLPTGDHTTASFTVTKGADDVSPTQTQPTNTPIPTAIPTPTEAPTPTFAPTPTLVPGGARISLDLNLAGLGESGNKNPRVKQKRTAVCVYQITADYTGDNNCNRATKKADGFIMFNNASKKFDATTFDLGIINEGEYEIFIKVDKYLRKRIPGTKMLKANTTTPIQPIKLVSGDITGNNKIDVEDYNAWLACFGDKAGTDKCLNREAVDLNDDGKTDTTTDFSDYKILLQNFAVREGD
ncbi:MAG: hypothetical protein HYV39_01220 [Candidatus Levybacteria bacterium]|nr:hypothetical protein [Candidatus Levybacteria bacterium]